MQLPVGELSDSGLFTPFPSTLWALAPAPLHAGSSHKRHFDVIGSSCSLWQPYSASIAQTQRLCFSTSLHPLVSEQSAIDLSSLDVRPFDCLVHLAGSLLHPEDILAGPILEDILHLSVTSPLYAQLHSTVPSSAMVSMDALSQPVCTAFYAGPSNSKQHVWQRHPHSSVEICSAETSAIFSNANSTTTPAVPFSSFEAEVAGQGPPVHPWRSWFGTDKELVNPRQLRL